LSAEHFSCLARYSFDRRFDAFRSIFPAGTVSGAPKIKAIEIIYSLEQERRGVYAGAVGRFDFADDEMDTCIAIRTMTFKDGVAYLQAGGGIVFDSVEEDEYTETINKLGGNLRALHDAEREFLPFCFVAFDSLKGVQDTGIKFNKIRRKMTLRAHRFTRIYRPINTTGSLLTYMSTFSASPVFFSD
jgi:hypothetical protein